MISFKKPTIIGMIHLKALLGYKNHPGIKEVISHALHELDSLERGGINAVLVENDNDQPHQVTVGPEIISSMIIVVSAVTQKASVPVGVEVLLNDPKASIAIAKISGASFIRTDYFVDRMSRPEYGGEMKIDPDGLLSYRDGLQATNISLLTDIHVKYAMLLEKGKTITESVRQAVKKKSQAIIVTGNLTGNAPRVVDVKEAKYASGDTPVLIGSGFSHDNAKELLTYADGAIVGTALKENGVISLKKTTELMKIVKSITYE